MLEILRFLLWVLIIQLRLFCEIHDIAPLGGFYPCVWMSCFNELFPVRRKENREKVKRAP